MYSHLRHARHVIQRVPDTLHVIAVVFNPLRFVSRYNLFKEFAEHATASGADLRVVEVAFGDRPFEVTTCDNPKDIQFRTSHELWHKERMINAAVARLPLDWKYMAWVDADVTFLNPDWIPETIQQLQHYQAVQLFTHAMDVGANMEPVTTFESFGSSYVRGREAPGIGYYGGRYWHPGYGWAYRREAWDMMGGMLDVNIVGGGDHQMAYGMIGMIDETIPAGSTKQYSRIIKNWANNAALLKRNIGAVPGTLVHHFHGKKANRKYSSRWKILTDNAYDPVADLKNDWQMMLTLSGNKIKLRDDLRGYFRARNEDSA